MSNIIVGISTVVLVVSELVVVYLSLKTGENFGKEKSKQSKEEWSDF